MGEGGGGERDPGTLYLIIQWPMRTATPFSQWVDSPAPHVTRPWSNDNAGRSDVSLSLSLAICKVRIILQNDTLLLSSFLQNSFVCIYIYCTQIYIWIKEREEGGISINNLFTRDFPRLMQ